MPAPVERWVDRTQRFGDNGATDWADSADCPRVYITGVRVLPMKKASAQLTLCLSVILLLCISAAIPGYGQDEEGDEGRFIFRNKSVQLSTFYFEIAPATYISSIADKMRGFTNLSVGFILNNRFYLSGFLILSPTIKNTEYLEEPVYVSYRQAGIKLGYMHRTDRMLFWRANLAVGLGGGYRLSDNNSLLGGLFGSWDYRASVFSLEPSLGLGFNLLPWWRLYVDLGYRIMGPNNLVVDIVDGNSITLMISFGFGNFRYKQPDK